MSAPTAEIAIRNSALWAAYGDALGFVTELSDASRVRARTDGVATITTTIGWRGRPAGRFGPEMPYPAGLYSDDTQLRLATCRSLRSDGTFDVEPFAKIELPVWLAYALGAGRGSRAAAESLCKKSVSWCTNFFSTQRTRYVDGGGNGAAMRIQPHIWAAPASPELDAALTQVIRNAIVTHGHPRGFIGAVFHALCLRRTLHVGQIPVPADWPQLVVDTATVPNLIRADADLTALWTPVWEQQTKQRLETACGVAVDEIAKMIEQAAAAASSGKSLEEMARVLGCFDSKTRGAGDRTAILALFASWVYRHSPNEGLIQVANLLGIDTDSVATMAGALLGATLQEEPPGTIVDAPYIRHEARRMFRISVRAEGVETFKYPDLMTWQAPDSTADVVRRAGDGFVVAGLGRALARGELISNGRDASVGWRWLELEFGQTLLAKARSRPALAEPPGSTGNDTVQVKMKKKVDDPPGPVHLPKAVVEGMPSLDQATEIAIKSGFDERTVGALLLQLASGPDGIERAMGFAAIVAKARLARARRATKD